MYPILQPVVEPFLLPKNKGNVFEDSFDAERDGTALPFEWERISGGFYTENAWYRVPDNSNSYIASNNWQHVNLYAECEYQLYTYSNRYCGIFFRSSWPGGNPYGYYAAVRNGLYQIVRVDNWTNTVITSVSATVPQRGIMRVEAKGPLITLFLNDRKVLEVSDGTYKDGGFGLYMRASAVNWIKAVRL